MTKFSVLFLVFLAGCVTAETGDPASYCERIAEPAQRAHCLAFYAGK